MKIAPSPRAVSKFRKPRSRLPNTTNGPKDLLEALSNAPVAVLAVDESDRIIVWNSRAKDLLGYEASEVLGRHPLQFSASHLWASQPASWCPEKCGLLQRAKRGELVLPHTTAVVTNKKQPKWINITHLAIRSPSVGQRLIVVHLLWDLNTSLETHHDLIHRIEEIEALLQPAAKPQRKPPQTERVQLTPRQKEILSLLARGASTEEIANRMVITRATARNHVQRLLARMGVHSRLEAVAEATRQGAS